MTYDNKPLATVPLAEIATALRIEGIRHRFTTATRHGAAVRALRARAECQDLADILRDMRTEYDGTIVESGPGDSVTVAWLEVAP